MTKPRFHALFLFLSSIFCINKKSNNSRVIERIRLEKDEHLLGRVVVPVLDLVRSQEVLHPLPFLQEVVQVLNAALSALAQNVVPGEKKSGKLIVLIT